jgi:hypothetical protein
MATGGRPKDDARICRLPLVPMTDSASVGHENRLARRVSKRGAGLLSRTPGRRVGGSA